MEIDIYDLIPRIHLEPITVPDPPVEFKDIAGDWASDYKVNVDDELQIKEILKKHKK